MEKLKTSYAVQNSLEANDKEKTQQQVKKCHRLVRNEDVNLYLWILLGGMCCMSFMYTSPLTQMLKFWFPIWLCLQHKLSEGNLELPSDRINILQEENGRVFFSQQACLHRKGYMITQEVIRLQTPPIGFHQEPHVPIPLTMDSSLSGTARS